MLDPAVAAGRPLVSCIMPTRNRRNFVPQAIHCFLRQDYANKELLIVDDGDDPVADLIPLVPQIRYIGRIEKMSLGAKRNLACRQARGSLIAHWDDDDWMARHRLSYQVNALVEKQADLCGLKEVVFYRPDSDQAWLYVYPNDGQPWLAGGTLCYTRAYWRRNPFPDLNVGEDTQFVWSKQSSEMLALDDPSFYVALVHPGNTCRKRTFGRRWRPYPAGEVRRLLADDWAFYHQAWPAVRSRTGSTEQVTIER
jgi:glycosyltransferase involved in cell wall biosynthesis